MFKDSKRNCWRTPFAVSGVSAHLFRKYLLDRRVLISFKDTTTSEEISTGTLVEGTRSEDCRRRCCNFFKTSIGFLLGNVPMEGGEDGESPDGMFLFVGGSTGVTGGLWKLGRREDLGVASTTNGCSVGTVVTSNEST